VGAPGDEHSEAAPPPPGELSAIDFRALKKSFAQLEPQSDKLMAYFFASLFVRNPEFRAMFPLAMGAQRRRLFDALARCVWGADEPESLSDYLRQLARDHRRYGVLDQHYRAFCDSLLGALQAFGGPGWNERAGDAWRALLGHAATIMSEAAREASGEPAWWVGEVVGHDRRGPDVAVVTLRTEPAAGLRYRSGQYLDIQVPRWPRVWRSYSIANAPRPDGTVDLHVRAIPGGRVSSALVSQTGVGDAVLIGPARGQMTAAGASSGTVLCVAGGTGLAPLKAIAEELASPARAPEPPQVRLLVAARDERDLYDLASLDELTAHRPALKITPVIAGSRGNEHGQGVLAAMARHLPAGPADVFVCGPPGMVRAALRLAAEQAPHLRVHADMPGSWRDGRRAVPCQPPGSGPACRA
jgi:NAD(P)H-flavin reductase/hemoglobin-like flavoprotein